MDFSKKLNFDNIFLFLFLAIFPLGQIVRIGILQPIDVIVGAGAAIAIFQKFQKPIIFKYFENFLIIASFSWLLGVVLFRQVEVFYGTLYLFRLIAYSYFFIYIWNFVRRKKENIELLLNSLLAVSVASAAFGWVQFFLIPDIRAFFTWGWDEHLFRLVGTFLDPTFLGLIIVFGLITSTIRMIEVKKKNIYIAMTLFLLLSLAFTYSRASYLAFIAGVGFLLYAKRKFATILYTILILTSLVFILPTAKNHVLSFTRTFSAIARIENYSETFKIFRTSPVFGIGYDNLCLARNKFLGVESYGSHSCSGSDSSLLFILATTGVAGFITFAYGVKRIADSLKRDSRFVILASCLIALLTHSLFSNSMFYPFIMGYMVILLAVSLGVKGEG